MNDVIEPTVNSKSIWLPIIAICLVLLTGLVGYNFYAQSQDEACRKLSMQPVYTVRVTGYRWSFSDGCEIQILWDHQIEPEWTEEWLFRGVHTRADD